MRRAVLTFLVLSTILISVPETAYAAASTEGDQVTVTHSGEEFVADRTILKSSSRGSVFWSRTKLGAQSIASDLNTANFNWSDRQMACLNKLWTHESNWNFAAINRHSGARGIPQALPGKKMAAVATDWKTNPITQIIWGMKYVKNRYGTPCQALSHWQKRNWY